MAAPAFVQAGTGAVWTTGAAVAASLSGVTVGNLVVLHCLQDGTGVSGPTEAGGSGTEELDASGTWTKPSNLSGIQVGNPLAAKLHVWLARATSSTPSVQLSHSDGDDLYFRLYEFSGVHRGPATTDVYENSIAGGTANTNGTSTTVADAGVVTLGPDRLACNFVGINDDLTGIAAFAGESGGDWAMPASFESSTGTDGTISLMTAVIASAGTIDGGSDTITSDGWGVVGLAFIPAAAAPGPPGRVSKSSNYAMQRRRM